MQHVINRGNSVHARGGIHARGDLQEFPVLSVKLFCKSESALKNSLLIKHMQPGNQPMLPQFAY